MVEQTKGIIFLSTPHSGANIVKFAEFARAVYQTNQHLRELGADDPRLRELHSWFLGFVDRLKVMCRTYCERREVRPYLPFLGVRLPAGILVVDETSAEPNIPGEVAIPLDEDHISICKPRDRSAQVYLGVLRLLEDCLPPMPEQGGEPPYAPVVPTPNGPVPQPKRIDPGGQERTLVYISFSSSDEMYRMELREALLGDVRIRELVWDDKKIPPAANVAAEIDDHVARARIMVMLVSPSYLDPKCQAWKFEIKQALAAEAEGVLSILWVPVHTVRPEATPFRHVQAAIPVTKPLAAMDRLERQQTYAGLRQAIRSILRIGDPGAFDVFVSYNSRDLEAVKALCSVLRAKGLEPWLDQEQLQPGLPWAILLEQGVKHSRSALIAIGGSGVGPWQNEEMRAVLSLAVRDGRSVLPLLLPGVPGVPELPLFLRERSFVDLREGFTEPGLERLVWGITGQKPGAT